MKNKVIWEEMEGSHVRLKAKTVTSFSPNSNCINKTTSLLFAAKLVALLKIDEF